MKKNRWKKILLLSNVVLFLFFLLVSDKVDSLRFFLIIPISILCGIGFSTFFHQILPFKNILSYITISSFLGLFINALIIFVIGICKFDLTTMFFYRYTIISVIFNVGVFGIFEKEDKVKDLISKFKPERVDILWIIIFSLFFIFLFKTGLENYFPNWDSFTFWGVDSKYIFENSSLRDNSFDLLKYGYLPFYSLQLSFVYQIYGMVVEQFSGLLTIYYSLISVCLIISEILANRKSPLKKFLIYFFSFVSLHCFLSIQGVIFTQYADVFCSAIILVFAWILFNGNLDKKTYWKRILVLFFLSISLYLTKYSYKFVSAFLLLSILIYDFSFLRNSYKSLLKDWKFYFSIFTFFVFVFLVYRYALQFQSSGDLLKETFSVEDFFSRKRLLYILELSKSVFSNIPFFATTFLSLLTFLILSKKLVYKSLVQIGFLFGVIVFPLTFYLMNMWGFEDQSLFRYLSLIFLASPLIFSNLLETDEKGLPHLQKFLIIFITSLVCLLLFMSSMINFNFHFKFNPVSGKYKDLIWYKDFYNLAQEVERNVQEDSTILIVDQEGDLIGNMGMPVIIVRYFLSNYSIGNQYRYPVEMWYDAMLQVNPEYILVFTYDGYWLQCNNLLTNGESYLIKMNPTFNKEYTEENCFFEEDDIFLLK